MKKQNAKKIDALNERLQVLNVAEQKTIKGGFFIIEDHLIH